MMRAAVYSGSRNLYPHMVTAAKSLVANSSVEKIYFLIEDDKFRTEELADSERWVAGKPKNLISEYKMFGD